MRCLDGLIEQNQVMPKDLGKHGLHVPLERNPWNRLLVLGMLLLVQELQIYEISISGNTYRLKPETTDFRGDPKSVSRTVRLMLGLKNAVCRHPGDMKYMEGDTTT